MIEKYIFVSGPKSSWWADEFSDVETEIELVCAHTGEDESDFTATNMTRKQFDEAVVIGIYPSVFYLLEALEVKQLNSEDDDGVPFGIPEDVYLELIGKDND